MKKTVTLTPTVHKKLNDEAKFYGMTLECLANTILMRGLCDENELDAVENAVRMYDLRDDGAKTLEKKGM